jgi:Cdc6-like AAA superfamily ATPase
MESKQNKDIKNKKARNYQLTLNQVDRWDKLLEYLISLKGLDYLIAAKEKGEVTEHEHIHCYIQLKYSMKLSIKKLEGAHIEICRGSPQQNRDYIIKNGDIIKEIGIIKPSGGYSISYIKSLSDKQREYLPFVYYTKLKNLKQDENNIIKISDYYKDVKVYYIYGDSGTGKTEQAINMIKKLIEDKVVEVETISEVKYINGFWIGIDINTIGEIALYDDFRDDHMNVSEFINFIDYNIHNMNIKNGCIKNKFKYIFITSIQSPYEIYKNYIDNEPKIQWLRRIHKIIYKDKKIINNNDNN